MQNIKQTNGSNITITNIKFEVKEVILDHARVKYCYSAERSTTFPANWEVDSQYSKEKILVESVEGDVELPNLEEFNCKVNHKLVVYTLANFLPKFNSSSVKFEFFRRR